VAAIDLFAFEHTKEDLSRRIIITTAHSTHAGSDIVVFQEALIFMAGKL
jgi:hypothetical protein